MRDAAEAQRHRIDALERERDDVRRELEALRGRAERADAAEAKVESLERRNEALERRLAPDSARTRRNRMLAASALTVVLGGASAYHLSQLGEARRETAMAQHDAAMRIATSEAQQASELDGLRAELEALRQRSAEAEDRVASARAELEDERRIEQALRAERSFVAVQRTSRRVTIAGRDDLPRECTFAVSPVQGECRARVTCGSVEIYPAPGTGGYFSCEAQGGHLVRGRDVNGTAAGPDPMLDVDGPSGVITVSDGPAPAWSVRIATEPL